MITLSAQRRLILLTDTHNRQRSDSCNNSGSYNEQQACLDNSNLFCLNVFWVSFQPNELHTVVKFVQIESDKAIRMGT